MTAVLKRRAPAARQSAKPLLVQPAAVTAFANTPLSFVNEGAASQIAHIRRGISPAAVTVLADHLDMSRDALVKAVGLASSTVKARRTADKPLSTVETERLARVARVVIRAAQVFEDNAAALAWVKRPNRSLGGEMPLALLDTDAGIELVLDTLGRIENGITA
ncbi:type II toxin-antitoxin system Xre/ParS family antitoxin [Chitinimonas sp.]|uniref:type II RES/Xre toxin-antitoxin system antitoxin n=1 Tax=Chitinimonas sp. TaxID=1934313 RepID=UPI002F9392E8